MRLAGHAIVAEITRLPSIAEDGSVLKTCDTNGDGRVGAVVVNVGPDQHQALQHAECKARTYGKALFGLASLLCLSVCGNLASSALSILVFKESRFRGAIQPVVLSDSRAAAPVGTGLTAYGAEVPAYERGTAYGADEWAPTGMKRCAVAPSGTEACWELADPDMTDIPDNFLEGNTDLTGTLKVGPAVKTIGASAFANTKLAGLDLSEATSLVSIGDSALFRTDLEGTLVIPAKVTTVGARAFAYTKLTSTLKVGPAVKTIGASAFAYTTLTGLGLTKATSLVSIGAWAFYATNLADTLVIPAMVTTIGSSAFQGTKLTGLDLSKAASLVSIVDSAFFGTDLGGTLVIPAKVTMLGEEAFYNTKLTGLDLSKATSLDLEDLPSFLVSSRSASSVENLREPSKLYPSFLTTFF